MDEDYTPRDDVFEYGANSDYETDLEIYSDVDETLSDISPMNNSDESLLVSKFGFCTRNSSLTVLHILLYFLTRLQINLNIQKRVAPPEPARLML